MYVTIRCNCSLVWDIQKRKKIICFGFENKSKRDKGMQYSLKSNKLTYGNMAFTLLNAQEEIGYLVCPICRRAFLSDSELSRLLLICKYSKNIFSDFISFVTSIHKTSVCFLKE